MNGQIPSSVSRLIASRHAKPCAPHGLEVCAECLRASVEETRQAELREIRAGIRVDRAEAILLQTGIPPRYQFASLSQLVEVKAARMQSWLTAAAAGSPGALLLLGPVGTGKTHAACALLRAAAERGVSCQYTRTIDVARRAKAAWSERGTSEKAVMDGYLAPRILVLDELGVGTPTDGDAQRVHALIDDRYNAGLPTVFVSNLTPEDLKVQLGDRSYDRIRDGAISVGLVGESRRTPQ